MRIIKWMLLLIAAQISLSVWAVETAEVKMHVGSLKMLPIKNIVRVAIGKGEVVSSKIIDGKGLLLIAEKPGDTELRIWRKGERESRIQVSVTMDDPAKQLSSVRTLLKNFPYVKTRQVNGAIIMEGFAMPEEIEQLKQIQMLFPYMVNLVKERKINAGQMIRMDVKIVEFSKKQLKNIGIKWDTVLAGPAAGYAGAPLTNDAFAFASPSINGTSDLIVDSLNDAGGLNLLDNASFGYVGLISGITSQINLLMDSGDAKLLAEPMLNTRSGESATFLAGGEFPIPVPQDGGNTIEFKEYGVKLEIEPVADDSGNIQSSIVTEVSTLDFSVQSQGVPGLLSRKTESVINARNGETIVIAGIVNSEQSKAVSKVPWLGDIPIIGELFKSKDYQNKKSELVVFVTPRVVTVDGEENTRDLKHAREMINKFDEGIGIDILD